MSDTLPAVDNRVAVATEEPSRGRIAVLTADKVEEVEFFYPYYRFVEAGYRVDVITPSGGPLTGFRGFGIQHTQPLADTDAADYLLLYVPGGLAPTQLRTDPAALDFIRAFATAHKPIGLVCHGPQVLVSAGLVDGLRLTSWPEVGPEIEAAGGTWIDEPVIQDRNIFTARKPGDLPAELHRIMTFLGHQEDHDA
ncbi:type 1 glutamine amidotransferase domain-containing protein [Streptomyces sp. NPDC001714]|uniref:type 1 glutamine amidotransferase domain-containing protein n=1 Tax=Streptomyces sp. NPDC001714 TaxID=3364603 RepID=UPI00367ADD83